MFSCRLLFAGLIFSSSFLSLEGVQNSCTSDWVKMNGNVVCFGARGNRYGSLHNYVRSGLVAAIKLEHVSGYVSCASGSRHNSHWGCAKRGGIHIVNSFNAIVTDKLNQIIFPKQQYIGHATALWYRVPFADPASSKEIIFTDFAQPFHFPKYKEMRIWYGEDLKGITEQDNHGRVCVNVYAKFML